MAQHAHSTSALLTDAQALCAQQLRRLANMTPRSALRFLLLLSGIILAISVIYIVTDLRFQINPDGVSYLSIARAYAHFEFQEAINGYWGPLVSWLLVPAFWLQLDPAAWFYTLNVATAIAIVFIFHGWARKQLTKITPALLLFVEITLLLTLATFALSVFSPDMLFCLALVVFALRLAAFIDQPSFGNASLLGATTALLFYAKAVGLPLFILVFAVCSVILVRRQRTSWKTVLTTWVAAGLLVAPFCVAISLKYHRLTFSTSSTYNLALISPIQQRMHPINKPGIFVPHYADTVSPWDDPTYLPMPAWSPLHSRNDAVYYMHQVWLNSTVIIGNLVGFGAVFAAGLAALVVQSKKAVANKQLFALLIIIGVGLCILYALTLVESRYLWGLAVFAFFGLASLAERLFVASDRYMRQWLVALLGILALTSLYNMYELVSKPVDVSAYRYAQAVSHYIPPHTRVAYDSLAALSTCYWAELQCVGQLSPTQTDASIARLQTLGVTYFVIAGPNYGTYAPMLLQRYVTVSNVLGIYQLR